MDTHVQMIRQNEPDSNKWTNIISFSKEQKNSKHNIEILFPLIFHITQYLPKWLFIYTYCYNQNN